MHKSMMVKTFTNYYYVALLFIVECFFEVFASQKHNILLTYFLKTLYNHQSLLFKYPYQSGHILPIFGPPHPLPY